MKKGIAAFLGLFFALTLYAAAAVPDREFSLSPYAKASGGGAAVSSGSTPREGDSSSSEGAVTKRPWIAALETFSINIGVWAVDRYALNRQYARISWSTWKYNLSHGWIWDPDNFHTGFIGHPYHGAQYFNSARSLGMNFWESLPYSLGGYVMWGYFMENDQPSKNDLIMTGLAGAGLGEVEYRLSSQVLDDTATGGERTWREILAFMINPIRGFNRLIYGDAARVSSTNRETREPLHGTVSLGGFLVSETGGFSGMKFSPGLSYDVTYGVGSSEIYSQKPYDLFFLNGEVRYGQQKVFLNLDSYGLLWGHEFGAAEGSKSVVGIFQHYDYLNNETMHMGSTSFAGGLVSTFPLGNDFALQTSFQLGLTPVAGIKNPYVLIEDRDYNYDWGGIAKAEAWLSHPKMGTLAVRFGRFQLYSINAAVPVAADEGHDFLTYLRANYTFPLAAGLGLRVEYGWYDLHQEFSGHLPVVSKLSRVGAALDVRF